MLIRLRSTLTTALSVGLVLLIAASASARDLPTGNPRREGLSQERLERITVHMNQAVEDGIMVGGLGMITRNGKLVYKETYGLSDREAGKPMTEDAIFRIYSMSKPITSVALMVLYEEGRFFLNDPVAKYLPELAALEVAVSTADGETSAVSDGTTSSTVGGGDESKVGQARKPARQPTIRDLMRHTAGLTYGIFGDTEVDRKYREAEIFGQKTIEDFVVVLGDLPLQYEPGTTWHYSVSVDVMGRLVEVISGMRLGEFLKRRIFQPLEMTDTSFVVPAAKLDRLAQLYSPQGTSVTGGNVWKRNESKVLEVTDERANENFMEGATLESGGGGLVSTAADYMRFCLMLLNGGELDGARILSTKSVELMSSDHLGEIGFSSPGVGFGLGFAVVLDPGQVGELGSAGAYSWGGAAGTRFWIDPQERLVGLFMVQSIPHQTRLGTEFKVLAYQAIVD